MSTEEANSKVRVEWFGGFVGAGLPRLEKRSTQHSLIHTTPQRSPSDFLKSVLGRPVRVKLNSGIEYRGILACLDGYLNIAMEQTEEYVDGQLKAKYGDCFLRGNNGACGASWFGCNPIASLTLYVSIMFSSLHFAAAQAMSV